MSIKWYGEEIKGDIRKAVHAGLTRCGMVVQTEAKLLCPVDTGRLRNSIIYRIKKNSVFVGTNVDYAPHVEFGTVKMKPQSFLRAGLDNQRDDLQRIFEIEFNKHL